MNSTYANPYTVADQPVDVRATFIRKTYGHLAGAVLAFAVIEAMLLSIPAVKLSVINILASSPYMWLVVMGVFMVASTVANKWAMSTTNKSTQYMGLGLYIVAQALIMLPLLIFAQIKAGDNSMILKAGGLTAFLFAGLTLVAFTTKKDFSFLGGILKVGGMIALGVIVIAIVFPSAVGLGLWFSVIMVGFAAASILYDTSNIIHHYGSNQYVAASLGLFASVALMFWYILQIFMSRD